MRKRIGEILADGNRQGEITGRRLTTAGRRQLKEILERRMDSICASATDPPASWRLPPVSWLRVYRGPAMEYENALLHVLVFKVPRQDAIPLTVASISVHGDGLRLSAFYRLGEDDSKIIAEFLDRKGPSWTQKRE